MRANFPIKILCNVNQFIKIYICIEFYRRSYSSEIINLIVQQKVR